MKIEIDWGHEKIQEFLNDEDFVFFGQEVAKLQKQKLNEDEIKSFCKTFKEKKNKRTFRRSNL